MVKWWASLSVGGKVGVCDTLVPSVTHDVMCLCVRVLNSYTHIWIFSLSPRVYIVYACSLKDSLADDDGV